MRPVIWIAVVGIALPLTAFLSGPESWAEDKETPRIAIEKLIQDLGADDFRTREAASKALAAQGKAARAALEKARDKHASPEVRWRAEQLLRRLEGNVTEKRLDGGATTEGTTGGPATPDAATPKELADSAMKRLEKLLGGFGSRGQSSPFGTLMGRRRVTAPGLVLERSLGGRETLRVRRKDDAGAVVEDVFRGRDLEDILESHPELVDHEGMEELKRRKAEGNWPGMDEWRKRLEGLRLTPFKDGSGFGMSTSQGVEIRQGADGATVTIRERGEDGKEVVKEYKGATIDEIKKAHPELKDKLGSVSVRIGPPQIFWPGMRRTPLTPFTPRAKVTGRSVFGLRLTQVSEALASHLGLDPSTCALVDNVLPGSQAEAIGLLRNDILVKVGEQAVGVNAAADLLRKAGASKAALSLEIIRRGKSTTLTR